MIENHKELYVVLKVYIGDWSNGMIGVSKTFGGGSIPSSPALKKELKPLILLGFRLFFILRKSSGAQKSNQN